MRAAVFLLFFAALTACNCLSTAKDVELEGFDMPDLAADSGSDSVASVFLGEPQSLEQCSGQQCQEIPTTAAQQQQPEPKPRAVADNGQRRTSSPAQQQPQRPKNYYMEAGFGVLVVLYILVALWGARENGRIADAFARTHCTGDAALFPRQFSLCGAGELTPSGHRTPLVKEGAALFKFYASGRRYCQGCLATLSLRNRPDLLSWALHLFLPAEDLLEIDVYMNEANMQPMVLAIATPRQVKSLSKRPDVKAFTKPLKLSPHGAAADSISNWPIHRLSVLAEHSSLFYDLFSDPRVAQLFTSPAHADMLRLFRSLLLTSENSGGSHKRLLRFVFALPAADDMGALGSLLALVPLLVDLVGVHKLSPELKKRALDARSRQEAAAADAEDERKRRIEALQKRKLEKAQEEKERLARLAPEARRKAEEKLAKQAAKKSMKVKMMRM